jgi:hypothetical protein
VLVCIVLAGATAQLWSENPRDVWAKCVFAGLFVGAWLIAVVYNHRKMLARAAGTLVPAAPPRRSIQGDARALRRGLLMALLSGVAVGIVIAVMVGNWYKYPLFDQLGETQGKILSTAIVHQFRYTKARRAEFYLPQVTYQYTADGKEYQNTQVEFVENTSGTAESVGNQISQYPVGGAVTVWYVAKEPQRAALVRGMTGDELIKALELAAFGLLVTLVQGLLVVLEYKGVLASKK